MLGVPGVRFVRRSERDAGPGDLPGRARARSRPSRCRGELDDPIANAEGFPIRPAAAAALFGRLGIDRDTTVVAYDDGGSVLAARLFFVLEYYGHERVRVVNGGLGKWRREGRPLESTAPTITPAVSSRGPAGTWSRRLRRSARASESRTRA